MKGNGCGFFGLDSGDAFTGVYLFLNSWSCINYMCTALTYQSHLYKVVKKIATSI